MVTFLYFSYNKDKSCIEVSKSTLNGIVAEDSIYIPKDMTPKELLICLRRYNFNGYIINDINTIMRLLTEVYTDLSSVEIEEYKNKLIEEKTFYNEYML